jgi:hypothetical protein
MVGRPPDSSFDAAVRAAGSVLRHYATRGRKATLVTTGRAGAIQPVSSVDGDFRAALGVLAAAEPDALHGLAAWLRQEPTRAAQTGELVVVTTSLEPAALDAVVGAASRRLVSVVWVDAPSYAGKPTRAAAGALRLSGLGIPVAVVRRGEELAAALDFGGTELRAHA